MFRQIALGGLLVATAAVAAFFSITQVADNDAAELRLAQCNPSYQRC
jgi:hypothetical protein